MVLRRVEHRDERGGVASGGGAATALSTPAIIFWRVVVRLELLGVVDLLLEHGREHGVLVLVVNARGWSPFQYAWSASTCHASRGDVQAASQRKTWPSPP